MGEPLAQHRQLMLQLLHGVDQVIDPILQVAQAIQYLDVGPLAAGLVSLFVRHQINRHRLRRSNSRAVGADILARGAAAFGGMIARYRRWGRTTNHRGSAAIAPSAAAAGLRAGAPSDRALARGSRPTAQTRRWK